MDDHQVMDEVRRLVAARDRACDRLLAGETGAWLSERGFDEHALRAFAGEVHRASLELETSHAASFMTGFLVALQLVDDVVSPSR